MVERLLDRGMTPRVWNRPRAKAEQLAARGAVIVEAPAALADADLLFVIVSTSKDLEEVCFGPRGVIGEASGAAGGKAPGFVIDLSSIGADQSSAIRARLARHGVQFLCSPVSGNNRCVERSELSARPILGIVAGAGVRLESEHQRAR